jgi:hypothetical protein
VRGIGLDVGDVGRHIGQGEEPGEILQNLLLVGRRVGANLGAKPFSRMGGK